MRTRNLHRPVLKGLPGGIPLRADAGANAELRQAIDLCNQLKGGFEEFKATLSRQVEEDKKNRSDVLTKEQVDRINNAISSIEDRLTETNAKLAAARIIRDSRDSRQMSPESQAYYDAFSDFVRKGIDAGLNSLAVKAGMSTESNPDGGYLVPVEVDRVIQRIAINANAIRQLATVVTTTAPVYQGLHNLGGAGSGWVSERGTRTETNTPTVAEVRIPTNEMYAQPALTQTLLDDAFFDLEAWISGELDIAFNDLEGNAFVNGSGVGQPSGFLGAYSFAASTISSPSAWQKVGFTKTGASGDFAAAPNGGDALITLQDLIKPTYLTGASWLMNRASRSKVRLLKNSQGDLLWQPGLTADQPSTLLGYPVYVDDNMPSFNSGAYPIGFGDWKRFYYIVDRLGTRVLRDPFTKKPYVLFYTTKRVGGGIRDFHAVKFLQSST